MPKEQLESIYYKQGQGLISGLPLPTDEDGRVRNKIFINCDFHPNCDSVEFVNCEFERCTGHEKFRRATRPRECCSLSDMCEEHRTKMGKDPELLARVDMAVGEDAKRQVVADYIAAAYQRGEFTI